MSSLTEIDIRENSDPASCIPFPKANNILHILVNLCVTKKEVGNVNHIFPHIITFEIWLQEEASCVQLDPGLRV